MKIILTIEIIIQIIRIIILRIEIIITQINLNQNYPNNRNNYNKNNNVGYYNDHNNIDYWRVSNNLNPNAQFENQTNNKKYVLIKDINPKILYKLNLYPNKSIMLVKIFTCIGSLESLENIKNEKKKNYMIFYVSKNLEDFLIGQHFFYIYFF